MNVLVLMVVLPVVASWSGVTALDKSGTIWRAIGAVDQEIRKNMGPADAGPEGTERAGT